MKRLLVLLVAVLGFNSHANASLIYQLDHGSSITLLSTGQTYALSGGFVWNDPIDRGYAAAFTAASLDFVGGPIALALSQTAPFPRATSVFPTNDPDRCITDLCETFFGVNVDMSLTSGQRFSDLGFSSVGTNEYDGHYLAPTRLMYSELLLVPNTGGSFLARMNFSASLIPVPEPASLFLIAAALVACFTLRRWPPGNRQTG